jgi:anti-anti-sigma factor
VVADVSGPFDVTVVEQAGAVSVRATGELDLASSPILESTLAEVLGCGRGDLHLDLGAVTFVDSTALKVLVRFYRLLDGTGRRLLLVDPSDAVVRVLGLAGLADLFTIAASPR